MGSEVRPILDRASVHAALCDALIYVLEVPESEITNTSSMNELGVDSLVASQVIIELEIRLDTEIDVAVFERVAPQSTVSEVAALLVDSM